MRTPILPLTVSLTVSLTVLLACLLAAAAAGADEEVRQIESRVFTGDANQVHVDLAFGSVTVEGVRGRDLEAVVAIHCHRQNLDKCRARAEKIRLRPRMKGDTLVVKLKHTPKGRMQGLKAHVRLRVPRRLGLDINVRGGGVRVDGMRGGVEIDSVAGDVEVSHKRQRVEWVKVDVGIGDADLHLPDSRVKGHGFPRKLRWYGEGPARINIDIGTGDVTVRLD